MTRAFISVHPAPYIDNMIKFHFDMQFDYVGYLEKKSSEKPWKNIDSTVSKVSLRKLLTYDQIILPGWYNLRVIIYFMRI